MLSLLILLTASGVLAASMSIDVCQSNFLCLQLSIYEINVLFRWCLYNHVLILCDCDRPRFFLRLLIILNRS